MNRNNRLSLNDASNYILNSESDFEELDDETDSDLEAEPQNHITSDDSESIIESSDEDEPSANAAGQNVIDFENKPESSDDDEPLVGKSRKISFHQQLWKMFTTGAGEKMILAISIQISRSMKFIQYQTPIRLHMSTSSILLQMRCLMPLQSKQTYRFSNFQKVVLSIPQEKKSKYSLVFIFEWG